MAAQHLTIGDIWIDVSVREGHDHAAEVTEHPVEEGANVADHIRPLPATLTLEGMVTNYPIEVPQSHAGGARASSAPIEVQGEPSLGTLGMVPGVGQAAAVLGALKIDLASKRVFAATPLHFTVPFDRVSAVHQALVALVENRKLVTVVTGLITYKSVALTGLHVERSGAAGRDRLDFQASGRVLRIVSSQIAKLPDPVDARSMPTKAKGNQSTAAAPTVTPEQISGWAKLAGIG